MSSSALNTKQCPKCHTENPVPAKFCRHCRYEFPEATITGGSLSPEIKSFKIREDKYWKGSKRIRDASIYMSKKYRSSFYS